MTLLEKDFVGKRTRSVQLLQNRFHHGSLFSLVLFGGELVSLKIISSAFVNDDHDRHETTNVLVAVTVYAPTIQLDGRSVYLNLPWSGEPPPTVDCFYHILYPKQSPLEDDFTPRRSTSFLPIISPLCWKRDHQLEQPC